MRPFQRLPVLLALASLAGCATPWRQEASTAATGCAVGDIAISEPASGSINNTWKATCAGRVYACSVPAAADYNALAACQLVDTLPGAVPPPASLEEKLAALKRAHDLGLLTDAEYATKKKALVDAY